ncbi:MAG: hypothetical protein KIT20_08385 [Alphaproteobacteria bacterium]|nr:hypothetical protein [Alphaproteobacteria bacterium]
MRGLIRSGALIGAALSILLAPAGPATAAERLRFALGLPPTHPVSMAARDWALSVEEQAPGALAIELESAGATPSSGQLDRVSSGAVDLALVNPGLEPDRFPVAATFQLPLTIGDARQATRALDPWYRAHAPGELPRTRFCLLFLQDPATLHATRRIARPDQLRGLRVRAVNQVLARHLTLMGALPRPVPAHAAREAFDRGELDAIAFPFGSLFVFGIERKARYHLDLPLHASSYFLVINNERFERLPAKSRAALDSHCTTGWAARIADGWARLEATGRERIGRTGEQHLVRLDEAEREAWLRSVEPLRLQWAERLRERGGNPGQMLTEVQAALAAYEADFDSWVRRRQLEEETALERPAASARR